MIKKYVLLSMVFMATANVVMEAAVLPTVPDSTVIEYDVNAKKIGYTPLGGKFVDCGKGFTIAASTTVTWNVEPGTTKKPNVITGPIHFAGANALLKLAQDLTFSGAKGFFTRAIGIFPQIIRDAGNATALALVSVNKKNGTLFANGFNIPDYTTVTWKAGAPAVIGEITISTDGTTVSTTGSLIIEAALKFSGSGTIATEYLPRVFTDDYAVATATGDTLFGTINDNNHKKFKDGFSIPAGGAYRWATARPLRGTITFADGDYAQLILEEDLHLGNGARFLSNGAVSINTQGNALVFEDEFDIAETLNLLAS